MRRIILGIACFLSSGLVNAQVAHPENTNIVGFIDGDRVCFNNDGAIASVLECQNDAIDEGYVTIGVPAWSGGSSSGINGCGSIPKNPVTSATCPFTTSDFSLCGLNSFVLVQTTKSGHFWAIKANSACDAITDIVPCLSTDAFDSGSGCGSPDAQELSIENGYIKLDTQIGSFPPLLHCTEESHYGRMVFNITLDKLFICSRTGWIKYVTP